MKTANWVPHVAPDNKRCRHLAYSLSCEEFEELRLHTRARCQVCDVPEQHRILFIDHDPFVGPWAVRGLLCNRCNSSLPFDAVAGPQRDAYLAAPWYRQLLDRVGVAELEAPEPPLGTVVRAGTILYRHDAAGWQCLRNKKWPPPPVPWSRVCRDRGPHRIKVISGGEAVPQQRHAAPRSE